MQTVFRLGATTLAVLLACNLTACGGSSSLFSGGGSQSSVIGGLVKQPASTTTTTASNEEPKLLPEKTSMTFQEGLKDKTEVVAVDKVYYTPTAKTNFINELQKVFEVPKGTANTAAGTSASNEIKTRLEAIEIYRANIVDSNGNRVQVMNYKDMPIVGDLRSRTGIKLNSLGKGYQEYNLEETSETHVDGRAYENKRVSRLRLYQQDNSIVMGKQTLSGELSDGTQIKAVKPGELFLDELKGNPTAAEQILNLTNDPRKPKVNYTGQAFSKEGVGELNYSVDFFDGSGSGVITELSDKGTIYLNQGRLGTIKYKNTDAGVYNTETKEEIKTELTAYGIQGIANFAQPNNVKTKDGTYTLGFFGDNAAEIAGFVSENEINTVGFGGVKVQQ